MHPFRSLVRAAALGLAACLAAPADAATISVPGDHPTIQAAENAAAPVGDTIEVAPGVYDEDVFVNGRILTIVGLGDGPSDVVLGGSPGLSTVEVSGESALTLRNVRITGADAPGEGGGMFSRNSSITIRRVLLAGNAAGGGAGGRRRGLRRPVPGPGACLRRSVASGRPGRRAEPRGRFDPSPGGGIRPKGRGSGRSVA